MFVETCVLCPYCGEQVEILVEPLAGVRQRWVSDCTVCCRPIELVALLGEDGTLEIEARRDTD